MRLTSERLRNTAYLSLARYAVLNTSVIYMKCSIKKVFLILLILSVSLIASNPTSKSGLNQKWINLGVGMSHSSSFTGFGGVISLNYYISKYLISARLVTSDNISIYPDILNNSCSDHFNDIAMTIGFIRKNEWLYGSISTGLGLINDKHKFTGNSVTTVGIPVESQLFLTPLAAIGIGLNIIGNINSQVPYFGILLCIQYGILR